MKDNSKRGYFVADAFRTNHLSLTPGGSTVKIIYGDHFKLYDKIKYPKAYIGKITKADTDIIAVEVDGTVVWKQ
jgi:hypothetical protein